jgi:hypothetical protein
MSLFIVLKTDPLSLVGRIFMRVEGQRVVRCQEPERL